MGGSAAIKASRNYSSTSAVVAFTPCVYYDKSYGGLPKPSLILEAGSYTVFGKIILLLVIGNHTTVPSDPCVTDDQFMVDRANQITEAQCQAGSFQVFL